MFSTLLIFFTQLKILFVRLANPASQNRYFCNLRGMCLSFLVSSSLKEKSVSFASCPSFEKVFRFHGSNCCCVETTPFPLYIKGSVSLRITFYFPFIRQNIYLANKRKLDGFYFDFIF